jgi:hypothetical protein
MWMKKKKKMLKNFYYNLKKNIYLFLLFPLYYIYDSLNR